MKLRCIKCKEEQHLGKDDVKAVAEIIERHKLDVSAFLDALAPIGGKCKDGDLHIYEFEETFRDDMHNLAEKIVGLDKEIITSRSEYDKLIKDRKEFESKLREIIKNIETKTESIIQAEKQIAKIYQECEDLTGTRNIKLWSIEPPK